MLKKYKQLDLHRLFSEAKTVHISYVLLNKDR